MAIVNIQDVIRFVKKLKRWWDRKDHLPPSGDHQPTDHQPWGPLPGAHQHQQHQNQNQINAENPHFVELRNRAIAEGNLMKQKFDEAHQAYTSKDGARAKTLSTEGKAHQRRRDELNKEAAEWIFRENNRDAPSDTIDLHGLYVHESVDYTERFINRVAETHGPNELKIIVGKGLHSQNFQAKLKPAIEKLVSKHHLSINLDNHNSGVLLVQRNVTKDQIGLDRQVLDRLSPSVENSKDGCLIM